MSAKRYGFLGLGQMGGPMAANIAKNGFDLIAYDKAGTEGRLPPGAAAAESVADVARAADTVFLSLPDGKVSAVVAHEIGRAKDRRASVVVDLSTTGPDAAREAAGILKPAGVEYIDCPVSGGRAGAIAATISLMWAGSRATFDAHLPVLKSFAKNPFHVGDEPGQGQVLKILNNFLSATAMVATSEAILFGLSQGLDMKTMLDVINVSTGQNTASLDKFPKRILTGTYDAGFTAGLLTKDLNLYLDNVGKAGTPDRVGQAVVGLWRDYLTRGPDSDVTGIYRFMRGVGTAST